jgi:hypothetical protein
MSKWQDKGSSVRPQCSTISAWICGLQGKEHLVFIVGKGNHSAGGVQKLKPAIEKLAQEERLTCIPNKPHDGCVYVILEGEGKVMDGVAAFFKKVASLFRKIFHKH